MATVFESKEHCTAARLDLSIEYGTKVHFFKNEIDSGSIVLFNNTKSYLTERTFIVHVKSDFLTLIQYKIGVPQGSIKTFFFLLFQ